MTYHLIAMIIVFGLSVLGCDAQVRENISRLETARDRLTTNPNDEEALSTILKLLRDKNGINRANAAAVLGQAAEKVGGSIKDKALPPLVRLLDEGDGSDKRAAAIAIRGFGMHASEAIPVLKKSLFPSGTDSAHFSAEALGKIGETAAVAVPDLLRVVEETSAYPASDYLRIHQTATQALGRIGPKASSAAPRLAEFLSRAKDVEFKIKLAVALMRINPASVVAVKEIEAILLSPDVDARVGMMMELTDAGVASRPALNVIKAAAEKDKEADVRAIARQLLAALETSK
jgi:hypothetical protein